MQYTVLDLSNGTHHLSERFNLIAKHPILSVLNSEDPIYAGGLVSAMLYSTDDPDTYKYSDYDIFFRADKPDPDNSWYFLIPATPEHGSQYMAHQFSKVTDLLNRRHPYYHCGSSEKAHTAGPANPKVKTNPAQFGADYLKETYQLIHHCFGTPEEIVSSFDFVNCAHAYTPLDGKLYICKEGVKAHLDGTLTLLDVQHFSDDLSSTDDTVVVRQLARIVKYCNRYNYTISDQITDLLMQFFTQRPNFQLEPNVKYGLNSGADDFFTVDRATFVWPIMKPYLEENDSFLETDATRLIDKMTEKSSQVTISW